jgi:protocatechuate 3,4-dioxygenase alpha subunit
MEKLRHTPSQTVGPFFAYGLTAAQYGYDYNSIVHGSLIDSETPGERIIITGAVYDGAGKPVSDAMIEVWQANEKGVYQQAIDCEKSCFTGFGRLGTGTDAQCRFRFTTIKPGSVAANQAPHINIILFMRGSLLHLYTRLYFSDEAEANEKDDLLNMMPPERRHTLIAECRKQDGITEYYFNIYMQGENETIFFQV